jgi:hypothetical protein
MTAEGTKGWVETLRAAARGKAESGIEIARAESSGLLDGPLVRVLTSWLMAAFVVAAALLRTRIAHAVTFDLMVVVLRTAALAFVVRALIASGLLLRARTSENARAGRVLAWSDAGIYERLGERERFLARADVARIVVAEEPGRGPLRGPDTVFVVGRLVTQQYWQLGPGYAASGEILGARLARWLERTPVAPSPAGGTPRADSIDRRYERAAQGKPDAGDIVVPEGFGYRLRAPYAALLGGVFSLDTVISAGPLRARVLPVALFASVLAVLFVGAWFLWMRRRRAVRLGIALVITPEEVLARGPAGVVGVPWGQLASAQVLLRLAWSPFFGSFAARSLLLTTPSGERLTFDAGFLGVPADVLAAWLDERRSARAGAPAEQGADAQSAS